MKLSSILLPFIFIALAGCVPERYESFDESDLKYLALLPQETNLIGSINFSKIRDTEIYDLFVKYAGRTPFESEEYQIFVEKTGFDIQQDLSQVYFAGFGPGDRYNERGIFIATGNFSPEKISDFIEEEASTSEKLISEYYHDFKLYRIPHEDLTFCFADTHTLIGGKDSLVMNSLDRLGKDNTLSDNLREELTSIRYKSQVWIWMNTENFIASLPPSDLGDRIKSLETIRSGQMSMAMSNEVKFDGICICGDEENAKIIRDMIKGAVATAKLNLSDDRDGVDILNKIDVETDGNTVTVYFNMSRDEIEHLLQKKGMIAWGR